MKQFLGFIGMTDVTVVEGAGFAINAEEAMNQ